MTLLYTVIAFHTCHILSSIAISLMLLGSTTIGEGILRRMGTLLGFLNMIRLPAPRPRSFGNKCHTRRCLYLYTIFVHFEMFGDCIEDLNVLTVCHDYLKALPMFIVIGKSPNHTHDMFFLINFLPYSFKILNHSTHGSKCSEIVQLGSIVCCIHVSCKVHNMVANIYPSLILSCAHMFLAVGKAFKLTQEIVLHTR